MKRPGWLAVAGAAAVVVFSCAAVSRAQDPTPPAQSAPPAPPASSSSNQPAKQKYSHANDFLIIGTIFDPKGYAFPGVELKIRRSTDKKYKWDSYTNSRGEFAVRVPQGSTYEMLIRTKGFADQTRSVDASTGVSEARLVFRMEPPGGQKQ